MGQRHVCTFRHARGPHIVRPSRPHKFLFLSNQCCIFALVLLHFRVAGWVDFDPWSYSCTPGRNSEFLRRHDVTPLRRLFLVDYLPLVAGLPTGLCQEQTQTYIYENTTTSSLPPSPMNTSNDNCSATKANNYNYNNNGVDSSNDYSASLLPRCIVRGFF